jgi:hypothetical protein
MPHTIEAAKTGRASCRSCKKTIEKGQFRLGEEVPNAFAGGEMTYNWHHLECAALKKPSILKQALETTELEIADRDDLLKTIETSIKNEKPTTLPYAESAPTARSTCIACGEKIEKGVLRVAIEMATDNGMFMRRAPSYLHAACAVEHTGEQADELFAKLSANSTNLPAPQLENLKAELREAITSS